MSVHYEQSRAKHVVRWREDGRLRARRFATEDEAVHFDKQVNLGGRLARRADEQSPAAIAGRIGRLNADRQGQETHDGVYPYATRHGVRWRLVYRQSDGTLSSRRGYTSRTAATNARRKLMAAVDRGEIKVSRENFDTFWNRIVAEKRAYTTVGAHQDMITHGRKRLLPFFGADRLSKIDEDRVREWLALMVEDVEAGDIAAKTINNARTWLSVALNEATRRGLLPRNPCDHVPALPVDQVEIEYLRLAEIAPYLEATAPFYTALAEFLIGTGARVSEAVATRWQDLELDDGIIRIYRQRSRTSNETRVTKGKRFRPVQIGPRLGQTLRAVRDERAATSAPDGGWVFLCPPPRRGRYAGRTEPVPPHRKTVHEWHEAALVDAAIRDMPLHSLRHTAAAAWLAAGHPLIFVQRQLGHRSITTTERHYGHLERTYVRVAAASTEQVIAAASSQP